MWYRHIGNQRVTPDAISLIYTLHVPNGREGLHDANFVICPHPHGCARTISYDRMGCACRLYATTYCSINRTMCVRVVKSIFRLYLYPLWEIIQNMAQYVSISEIEKPHLTLYVLHHIQYTAGWFTCVMYFPSRPQNRDDDERDG